MVTGSLTRPLAGKLFLFLSLHAFDHVDFSSYMDEELVHIYYLYLPTYLTRR